MYLPDTTRPVANLFLHFPINCTSFRRYCFPGKYIARKIAPSLFLRSPTCYSSWNCTERYYYAPGAVTCQSMTLMHYNAPGNNQRVIRLSAFLNRQLVTRPAVCATAAVSATVDIALLLVRAHLDRVMKPIVKIVKPI